MSQRLSVDWFRVLADLKSAGVSMYAVSELIDVPKGTLMGWKNSGAEPRYSVGERLVELWCSSLNRPRTELPKEVAPISSAKI
ncbi:MAG TPA: hypothetical protein DHV59_01635 [Oxalobacteraceae bacterium]|nr:hypothetical protein [Oxalobacteraceae bacterium]